MDLKLQVQEQASGALKKISYLKNESLQFSAPARPEFGDLSCNVAFQLSKTLKKPPHEIAKQIVSELNIEKGGLIESVQAAGPYVNFYFNYPQLSALLLASIAKEGRKYGAGKPTGKKLMVEYFHANTHKAVHIGHIRNIAMAESLCRILGFAGNRVVRVNYQGDIGPHVSKCVWAYMNRFKGKEPGEPMERGKWLGEVYRKANELLEQDPSIEAQVDRVDTNIYAGKGEEFKIWKQTRQWSLDYFESIYRDFGVKYDRFYFESEVEGPGRQISKRLLKEGVAKESEGAIIVDLKKYDLGVFLILKSDGKPLYSNKELALAEIQDKEHKPDRIIHVVGSEQRMHFAQAFRTLEFFRPDIAKKEFHFSYELVNLPTGKMKSREGKVVLYEDLKEKMVALALEQAKMKNPTLTQKQLQKIATSVALGAIKYSMIDQSPEKTIIFDWDRALDFSGNSAPYLQYSVTRAGSILSKAGFDKPSRTEGSQLCAQEKALLSLLLDFPSTIQKAAQDMRPHYISNYCYRLSTAFSDFYESVPVLKAGKEMQFRLKLVAAVKQVLENSLELLGIETMERM